MSLYEYPCPPGYQYPEQCADNCVWVPVVNEETGEFSHWKLCCRGCAEGTFCDEPKEKLDFFSMKDAVALKDEGQGVWTPCTTDDEDDDLLSALSMTAGADPKGLVQVQTVANPSATLGARITFNSAIKRIEMGGWDMTFWRSPVTTSSTMPNAVEAVLLPPQLPAAGLSKSDKFRTAFVILPEADGLKQYVVNVPESSNHAIAPYKFAVLMTREWHVLFLRDPISAAGAAAAKADGDCGCS